MHLTNLQLSERETIFNKKLERAAIKERQKA
jgi:hypothetical protein